MAAQIYEGLSPEADYTSAVCGVCPGGCAVELALRDGKIQGVKPDRRVGTGMLCPRGLRASELVDAPERILYPQRRVGPRGAARFQRASWDEAYDHLISELHRIKERHGPEAVCIYTGRGNFELGLNESFSPTETVESSANAVLFPFGSPNTTGVGALCYAAYGMIATRACFGGLACDTRTDIEHADLIIVWGTNPATDSPPIRARRLAAARQRGARVVVIDHRRSQTAKRPDTEWIGVRPGSDGALALGLINVIIEEGTFDGDFVDRWTHGFAELRQLVHDYTPEAVEAITWVPAAVIRRLAREIATTPRCSTLMYTGLEYSGCGVQTIRAVWSLIAITGHLDVVGGNLFRQPASISTHRTLTPPPAKSRPPIGAAEYPLYHETRNEAHAALLPRAILDGDPYPIRGLIISGSSLITSWPDPELWRRALAALDLLVVIDRFPTADSAYADLLLPAATLFETESYVVNQGRLRLRERVLPPRGESRPDCLIFSELASRLGYGDLWPRTEEGFIEKALQGTGISLNELREHPEGIELPCPQTRYRKYERGELRADGAPGFETPTGKFELASQWLADHGYEPLPRYTEPRESPLSAPELRESYPLIFNSGARTQTDFRSQYHNIRSLAVKHPAPFVTLHPRDASARDIEDGDQVVVETRRGEVVFVAKVTEDIVPGAIEANMGGGGPLGPPAWQRANVNALTDMDNRDPLSGFPAYKALLCEVRKKALIILGF